MVYADLRAKLEEKAAESMKWPELNFSMFLSLIIEMLHHCKPGSSTHSAQCFSLIAQHLEDVSSAISEFCTSPLPLKNLLKLYRNFMKLAKAPETQSVVRERLMQCVPKLFTCESELMVRTCCLVVEAVGEDESEGGSSVSMEQSLHRTIARRVVLFLMQYATLLDNEGTS